MPPLATEFCAKIPPPKCFEGPFVTLDNLLRTIATAKLEMVENGNEGNSCIKLKANFLYNLSRVRPKNINIKFDPLGKTCTCKFPPCFLNVIFGFLAKFCVGFWYEIFSDA